MDDLIYEINRRWEKIFYTKFIIYTLIFILGGSIGIWYPYFFEQCNGISILRADSLFTYSSAILITLMSDYFLMEKESDALTQYCLLNYLIGLISFIIIFYGYKHSNSDLSSYWAFAGTILVIIMWILTYSVDPKFEKKLNTGSFGGKADKAKLKRGDS